ANGLNSFPENFVVAKLNDDNPVTLTCGTRTDENVTWRFRNRMIKDGFFKDSLQRVGQDLIVSDVGTPMMGEYSCWRGEEKLSSTYLLLEVEGDELDSLISCRANSYGCMFSCTWTSTGYTAVRLGLGHDCNKGEKSCQWVSGSDGGFQFELSHSTSPYAEESTMLELTVEAIADFGILRRTKRFYLRDIIQPDSPQIVKCQEEEQYLNVTINAPSSWSTPHSFFSLEHEIEYVFKDDGTIERSSSALIPKKISKLRVRSRDSLVRSAWSQWSSWKNVTH
uniref:Interleukin-12 subunit beta n=2 Tax=Monopterus albus TaxID=43700 RepID=A0A3Q3KA24_MONAL